MLRRATAIVYADGPPSWGEFCAEVVLAIMILFAPLAFGATEAWSQQVLIVAVSVMMLALLIDRLFRPQAAIVRSWAWVPIAAFFALALLQAVALPTSVIQSISPATASLRSRLPGQVGAEQTLSLYPHATWAQIRLLLAIAGIFFVGLHLYQTPGGLRRLLTMITVAGSVVVVMALCQNLMNSDTIYGTVPAGHPFSGPFMNHSHFGQYVNLTIGCAVGLVLMLRHRSHDDSGSDPRQWFLRAYLVLAAIALCLSMTRGGMVSLFIAGALTTVLLMWRYQRRGRASMFVLVGVVAVAVMLYIGFDPIYERLASLREVDEAQAGRWQILRDLSHLWAQFPVWGTGLGTHRFVFPMVDSSNRPNLAAFAENEYAQLMEETGAIGVGLAACFLGVVGVNFARAIRRPHHREQAAAFGLGLGLIAVLIHSLSDFAQHVPAVAMVTALVCAALINIGRRQGQRRFESQSNTALPAANQPVRGVHWSMHLARRGMLTSVVAVVAAWAVLSANTARQAEAAWTQARAGETDLQYTGWANGSDEQYKNLISAAQTAADLEPNDIRYRYWLNVYRLHAISRRRDAQTNEIVYSPQQQVFARRIVKRLHALHALCPTFGPPYAVAGRIERFVLDRPEQGAAHIQTASRLTSNHAQTELMSGRLALDQQRWEMAADEFGHAIALGSNPAPIFRWLIEADQPRIAHELAAKDRPRLLVLAGVLKALGSHEALGQRCRSQALALLKHDVESGQGSPREVMALGDYHADRKDLDLAIAYYRRALHQRYGQVRWRLKLADALAQNGRRDQAMQEARLCLRLKPQWKPAKSLIADLTQMQSDQRSVKQ